MSSNLPPGVTENMIPGNRPEDADDDAFFDKLLNLPGLERGAADAVASSTALQEVVIAARDLGFAAGYNEGRADEGLYRDKEAAYEGGDMDAYDEEQRARWEDDPEKQQDRLEREAGTEAWARNVLENGDWDEPTTGPTYRHGFKNPLDPTAEEITRMRDELKEEQS
jgi:hypothetical protein